MKHLKKYNENNTNREITSDIINTCFAYAFDLTDTNEMYEIFAEVEVDKDGLYDFFGNIGREESYIEGYQINFETKFYDKSSVEEFRKYIQLINEIDEGIDKLREVYKVDIIQFDGVSNSVISLQIAYSDIKSINN